MLLIVSVKELSPAEHGELGYAAAIATSANAKYTDGRKAYREWYATLKATQIATRPKYCIKYRGNASKSDGRSTPKRRQVWGLPDAG
jgi:hypothetical protein